MKKPVYIVVVPFFPSSQSWRGGFFFDFVSALMRTGKYEVVVICSGSGEDYVYNGIFVHKVKLFRLPFGFASYLFRPRNSKRIRRKILDTGISWNDVVVFHSHGFIGAGCFGWIKKNYPHVKTLLHNHSGPLFHLANLRFGVIPIEADLIYCSFLRIFQNTDLLVCCSDIQAHNTGKWYRDGYLNPPVDVREDLLTGRWMIPWHVKNTYVLYNGIDKRIFNENGRNEKRNGFVIGCVGNVNKEKGQMTLLRAIPRVVGKIEGLRVVLVGAGPNMQECMRYVADNGLADIVEFRKEVDHLDLPRLYRSFDLLVIPSIIEGFCCSYVEAFGCGTPFMGCRGVSVEEAFSDEEKDKWLIAPGNDAELAVKIESYYRERPKQHLVQDFDIDCLIADFVDYLQRLLI